MISLCKGGAKNLHFRVLLVVALVGATASLVACSQRSDSVTLYASIDRDVAEPLLQAIDPSLRVVYDTEANKTAGLVNRLMAEKSRPQADVFWNGEIVRTIALADAGVLTPTEVSGGGSPTRWDDPNGRWFALGGRLRVLVVGSSPSGEISSAASIDDLASERFRNRAAIANPRFGTTSTHFSALLAVWGESRFRKWLRDLRANGVAMLPGNAQVRDAVAAGEFDLGLTDSDDVVGGLRQGLEIRMIVPDQESDLGALMIPNTVGRISGRPDTESARALVQSLLSADTEKALALSRSAQIPLRHSVEPPSLVPPLSSLKLLSVDYVEVARYLPRMLEILDEEWPR